MTYQAEVQIVIESTTNKILPCTSGCCLQSTGSRKFRASVTLGGCDLNIACLVLIVLEIYSMYLVNWLLLSAAATAALPRSLSSVNSKLLIIELAPGITRQVTEAEKSALIDV